MVKTNKFVELLGGISLEVYGVLGGLKFDEEHFQVALGYELTQKNIDYIRETAIELYYKEIPIKLGEPDFYLNEEKPPLIIEVKLAQDIGDIDRQQLKMYLVYIKRNPKSIFKKVNHGVLVKFLKTDPKKYEYKETEKPSKKTLFKVEIERFTLDEEENLVLLDRLHLGEI